MGIKKAIFLFYLMYTCYMILICGSTNLTFLYICPALLLMWLYYIAFRCGVSPMSCYKANVKELRQRANRQIKIFGIDILKMNTVQLLLFGMLSVGISVVCARYYTGQWPQGVVSNIINGVSNYIQYQTYFKEAGIATLSIIKVPFVLLLGVNNIIFVYSFIVISTKASGINVRDIIFILCLICAQLYFGIARGTNFEAYKLFLMLAYCYIIRQWIRGKKINYVLIGLMGIVLVVVFTAVLGARGASPDYRVTTYIHYDENAFFSTIFPTLAKYYLLIFSYLGFGIYYIGTLINEVWLSSIPKFLLSFFPFNQGFMKVNPIQVTNQLVDLGVKWVPDGARFMNHVGILGVLIICYLLGVIIKKATQKSVARNLNLVVGYLVFMFFCSLPVGHFLAGSSEKILIVYTIVLYILNVNKIKIVR